MAATANAPTAPCECSRSRPSKPRLDHAPGRRNHAITINERTVSPRRCECAFRCSRGVGPLAAWVPRLLRGAVDAAGGEAGEPAQAVRFLQVSAVRYRPRPPITPAERRTPTRCRRDRGSSGPTRTARPRFRRARSRALEPVHPYLQLGATRAAEADMVQPGPELGEAARLGFPVVLMDAEQRAVVECPDQMPESCVGVLVEHRFGTDQPRYQGPLTPRSRTVSATWLSAGKAIGDSSLFGSESRYSPGGARFTSDHRPCSGRTRRSLISVQPGHTIRLPRRARARMSRRYSS